MQPFALLRERVSCDMHPYPPWPDASFEKYNNRVILSGYGHSLGYEIASGDDNFILLRGDELHKLGGHVVTSEEVH